MPVIELHHLPARDVVNELGFGVSIALVFGGNVTQRGTILLLVDAVTFETAAGLRKVPRRGFIAGEDRSRSHQERDERQRPDQTGEACK